MTDRAKLRMEAEAAGFDQLKKDVRGVRDEATGLTDANKAAKGPVEELDGAQKRLNASTEDYTGLLGRIHPALGAIGESATKLTRILGDVGSANINLAQTLRSATAAIRRNAAAFKTLLAGGAAAAGIWLIVRAVRAMQEAYARVSEEIERSTKALNAQKQMQMDLSAQIESDARRRSQRKGLIGAEANVWAQRTEAFIGQYGLEGADAQIARDMARQMGGLEVTDETFVRGMFAALLEGKAPDWQKEPQAIAQGALGMLVNRPEVIEATQKGRTDIQAARQRADAEAMQQELLAGPGGSTAAIEHFLMTYEGHTPERAAELAKAMKLSGAVSARTFRPTAKQRALLPDSFLIKSESETDWTGIFAQTMDVDRAAISDIEWAFTHSEQMRRRGPSGNVIIQQNGRYYQDRSRRDKTNGESRAKLAESIGYGMGLNPPF